jgi:[acyl-carrier-protein] S-malonyltransferase
VTLAYIVGGGLNDSPGTGRALYDGFPEVRRWYGQIEEWTGLGPEEILGAPVPPSDRRFRAGIGALRQAAVAIGVYDVLAERGVLPSAIGGLSLGAMVGATLAGALDRRRFVELLMWMRDAPELPEDARAQGIAVAKMPVGTPWFWEELPDVHTAVEIGPIKEGGTCMVMLAGYRSALEDLALNSPDGVTVRIAEDRPVAFHSPLQRDISEFIRPFLDATEFRPPRIPLCSCLEPRTLRTPEEIHDLFLRNPAHGVSVPHVRSEMERHGARLGLVLGPSGIDRMARPSFPVVHIETPENVGEALSAIYELGIELEGVPL